MKISSISRYSNNYKSITKTNKNLTPQITKDNNTTNNNKDISFKSIYVEDKCSLGSVAQKGILAKFMKKDSLLLNEIATRYPNQDCFITSGYHFFPQLKYREKPDDVQLFTKNLADEYVSHVDPDDPDNPAIPLLLTEKEPLTLFFGVPSYISLNPSLPFTVQAGYEVHKKLLEKKYEILDSVGKNDDVDFGDKTVTELAHEAIADVETAVKRYLMESAYSVLTDKARASQLYASNYLIVQTRLKDKRRFDLTTGYSKQLDIKLKSLDGKEDDKPFDICEVAIKKYPNMKENQDRIEYLVKDLFDKKIFLA